MLSQFFLKWQLRQQHGGKLQRDDVDISNTAEKPDSLVQLKGKDLDENSGGDDM